ncbi:MAG: hypothetical protein ACYC0H_14855 [Solirubrobacteraceae bacterium]
MPLEQRLGDLPDHLKLDTDDSGYLWSEKAASELIEAPTVADQGKALASWAGAAFETILNLTPGRIPSR